MGYFTDDLNDDIQSLKAWFRSLPASDQTEIAKLAIPCLPFLKGPSLAEPDKAFLKLFDENHKHWQDEEYNPLKSMWFGITIYHIWDHLLDRFSDDMQRSWTVTKHKMKAITTSKLRAVD